MLGPLGNPPFNLQPWQGLVLLILGLIVGIMDVQEKYAPLLLVAFMSMLIAANAPLQDIITYYSFGGYIKSFMLNTSLFLTPTVVLMSLRLVFRIYYAGK